MWSAPAERSGDGALAPSPLLAEAKAVSRFTCHRTPYKRRPQRLVVLTRCALACLACDLPLDVLGRRGYPAAVLNRFTPILVLTTACWLVFLVNNLLCGGQFDQYGIRPRQLSSLPGIILAPFLHGSCQHLAANTLPLLVLGGVLCARSKGEFVVVTVAGILLGGGLTWLFARNACHIGASGLIFCYFGYLASLAYFHRTFGTLCLSVVCILGYGGLVWGIVPTSTAISWESHLGGLLAGTAVGWLAKLRKTPTGPKDLLPGSPSQP
jgi:membrane associated rhomboid family serine protease